jgi:hypothetical protein
VWDIQLVRGACILHWYEELDTTLSDDVSYMHDLIDRVPSLHVFCPTLHSHHTCHCTRKAPKEMAGVYT